MMIKLIIMFFGQNTAEDVLCQYQNGDKMAAVRQMRINFPQAGFVQTDDKLPQAGASGIGSFELQTPAQNFASLYD